MSLSNSSANSLFSTTFPFLTRQPEDVLSKNFKPLKEVSVNVHHHLDF